jgi:hypothetical protein
MNRIFLNFVVVLFAVYLFTCSFILAICVFMSNADLSPEVSLDLVRHPLQSLLLVALVALPFILMLMIGRGGRWSWCGLRLFSAGVGLVGVICTLSDHGWFEAFSGTGRLRHGTGMVYAISSACVFAISLTPRLRKSIAVTV